MKTTSLRLTLLTGLLLLGRTASAQDLATGGDPAGLKRYEGSVLFAKEEERYTSYEFLLSNWTLPDQPEASPYKKKQDLEGAFTRLAYYVPESERGVLEVHRNYLNDLAGDGWEILFSAAGSKELHGNFGYQTRVRQAVKGTQLFEYPNYDDGVAYIAARKSGPDGDTYATVYTFRYTNNGLVGPYENLIKPNHTLVKVDLIKPKGMEQRMVFVNAAKMKSEIGDQGHVSLYGILFDFNKADIKPESSATIAEIAKLLKDDAALKLLVVGHTDNVGTLDFNRSLSSRRALAVVKALVSEHGISAERLHAEGVAFCCPVSSNESKSGRAKNRRVELVRW
jgi:outer membrane protein OmpA-like peptidoglycan-associated protein